PYFLPSSLRILIRTYFETSELVSSVRWIQSSTTADAPGAMATLFIANSSGVAFLKSIAERDEAKAAIRTIARCRIRMDVGLCREVVCRLSLALEHRARSLVREDGREGLVQLRKAADRDVELLHAQLALVAQDAGVECRFAV